MPQNNVFQHHSWRNIPVDQWPELDQFAWRRAVASRGLLDDGGGLANLRPSTQRLRAGAYGHWLGWPGVSGRLDPMLPPAERLTPEAIDQFVSSIRLRNAPCTVSMKVSSLWLAVRAMFPDRDWAWLGAIALRLNRRAEPAREKRSRLIPPKVLLAFDIELMETAEHTNGDRRRPPVAIYRDGLMIALLAARPLRSRNFLEIEIDRHLIWQAGTFYLLFSGQETKNHRFLEFPIPAELIPFMKRYLDHHRPALCNDHERLGSRLWLSKDGRPLAQSNFYQNITQLTRARFGKPINPHLFRDCAATFIALDEPEQVQITMNILGHTSLATSERYYNDAQSLAALGLYNNHIRTIGGRNRPARLRLAAKLENESPSFGQIASMGLTSTEWRWSKTLRKRGSY